VAQYFILVKNNNQNTAASEILKKKISSVYREVLFIVRDAEKPCNVNVLKDSKGQTDKTHQTAVGTSNLASGTSFVYRCKFDYSQKQNDTVLCER
jgi:hypothetical protein